MPQSSSQDHYHRLDCVSLLSECPTQEQVSGHTYDCCSNTCHPGRMYIASAHMQFAETATMLSVSTCVQDAHDAWYMCEKCHKLCAIMLLATLIAFQDLMFLKFEKLTERHLWKVLTILHWEGMWIRLKRLSFWTLSPRIAELLLAWHSYHWWHSYHRCDTRIYSGTGSQISHVTK